MARGCSLEQDLKLLVNNPKYSDIEILCEDEKKLYGCRAILAARSEVFDKLLYNGMKESYENQISFPTINSFVMEIVLEYTYTGSIKEESITNNNLIEAFCAAEYFHLSDLQDFIMKIIKNKLETDYSPELLSKAAELMPLTEDNAFLNLLVEAVAIIPLNTIEFGRLSTTGLKYLLYCTHKKEKFFATPEYEVFRYSAILAAKQVSDNAFQALTQQLPSLEQIENPIQGINESITDNQTVAEELDPLAKFIDFSQIKGRILTNIIEPLKIISTEIIFNAYRQKVTSLNNDINGTRGIPYDFDYVWDSSACGSKLIIENNKKVVSAPNGVNSYQGIKAKVALEDNGIFEFDFVIEKDCKPAWVGVCSSEHINFETMSKAQSTIWVLSSTGYCFNSGKGSNYCQPFGNGAKVIAHVDMNKRTCAFTVNGKRYPVVSGWNNLPSKLYPLVTLRHPGRYRIQFYHRK
ncbi:uncharacterized protein OCT59_000867 [Rhizophagus irregularis]|uniref:Btb/poz domain containing protein n=3 Tax=Rhizophagus irregularis TaxID=588596 RepID=A0A916EJA8_9GLOM|nr:hypothetical protein RirG_023890 [Rhizophagus irregularis DAOM 197198w]UZN99600.1 hypothetical protein OCT59_000867 [Rhizophagus irregularis]CAB5188827.1 unnamed protein product [Rhizophagus irregularis]CAB5392708.1 unnamed protein product [Rhizophagus irregularis]CAG8524888.1 10772_t:CDS:1 [Rhizophagus irregularis]